MQAKRIHIRKLIVRFTIALMLLGIIMLVAGNYVVKSYGYKGMGDFISNYFENKSLVSEANPIHIQIDISDTDFDFIEKKRQEALDRGVQINEGDNYVDCTVHCDDKSVKGSIRLKGHMTDHLEGNKWSYRVKTEEPILGMYRFSLQHPGTRNYAYEWVYHKLLGYEGIIHLNYDFIALNLHDQDLGIYAIEEHFGQHVLQHNDRPAGAILRWNPGLYWEWRIDELHGIYLDEEYSSYTSSYPEPYDDGVVKRDSLLVQTYVVGARLLEQFRRGELLASEVFDVELMARFHAIIDLVGGYHSLDWSDVKFYYNTETGKIEPVGYESFSIRKTERIAGQRLPDRFDGMVDNYHDMLFSDPVFFAAYIKNLERICDEAYFADFIDAIAVEHRQKMAILALEWPHRRFSFDPYFENIELIRHNLELPKPFHAFLEGHTDKTIELSVAPVSDYPVSLDELIINGKEKIDIQDFVLPAKPRGTFTHYTRLTLTHHSQKIKNMVIRAHIPGSTNSFEIEVNEYPSYGLDSLKDDSFSGLDISEHKDIVLNPVDSTYFFNAKKVVLDKNYRLNGGKLRVLPDQEIHFDGGKLICSSAQVLIEGLEDHEVVLTSSGTQACFLQLNQSTFTCNNTIIVEAVGGMRLFESMARMQSCVLGNCSTRLLTGSRSEIHLKKCDLGSVDSFALLDRSEMYIDDCSAKYGREFLRSFGSLVYLKSTRVVGYDKVFDLSQLSILKMWNCSMVNNQMIAGLNNGSEFSANVSSFENSDYGFELDKKGVNVNPSSFNLYKTNQQNIRQLVK